MDGGIVGSSFILNGDCRDIVKGLVIFRSRANCRTSNRAIDAARVSDIFPVQGCGRTVVGPSIGCFIVNEHTGQCRAIGIITVKEIQCIAIHQIAFVIAKAGRTDTNFIKLECFFFPRLNHRAHFYFRLAGIKHQRIGGTFLVFESIGFVGHYLVGTPVDGDHCNVVAILHRLRWEDGHVIFGSDVAAGSARDELPFIVIGS